jgi:hypothetical protein
LLSSTALPDWSPAGWAFYAFLIPIIVVPHWLMFRKKFGGSGWMFFFGVALMLATTATFWFWHFVISEKAGELQKSIDSLRGF